MAVTADTSCGTPKFLKGGIAQESMSVDVNIDSNVSELVYWMIFDGPIDGENLLLDENAPRIGEANPFLPSKYATNVSPRSTKNPAIWEVVVSYDIMGAPTIEEGKAYDFGTRSITEEVVAQGAYVRQGYEVDRTNKKLITFGEEIRSYEIGGIPYTNTAGDLFSDPIMVTKSDILLSFWVLASAKTGDQVEDGTIYNFIGQTNLVPITLCGIRVKDYALTIEDIIPRKYRYYKKGATAPEDRYKLNFEIRVSPSATGYGTGVLNKGRNAKLYPRGETTGTKKNRPIWTSDIDPSIPVRGEGDEQVDYDVLLNKDGEILDQETENTCYIGYVAQDQFFDEWLPLPAVIGSYATA